VATKKKSTRYESHYLDQIKITEIPICNALICLIETILCVEKIKPNENKSILYSMNKNTRDLLETDKSWWYPMNNVSPKSSVE
jgi:hypothetical protein